MGRWSICTAISECVVGLERAMLGKQAGDTLKVVVAPADGYGEKTAGAANQGQALRAAPGRRAGRGMSFNAVAPNGHEVVLWVTEVAKNEVSLSSSTRWPAPRCTST